MNEASKVGVTAAGGALALGLLGDLLLRATPWGLNLTAWAIGLIAAYYCARRFSTEPRGASVRWLTGGVALFAVMFAWRDSGTLKTLDLISCIVLLGLHASCARIGPMFSVSVGGILRSAVVLPIQALTGAFTLLLGDITWSAIPRNGWSKQTFGVIRGVLIAAPLLLLFGALLASADTVFEHFLELAFNWDYSQLFNHVSLFLLCAWLAAGLLNALLRSSIPQAAAVASRKFSLGTVEIATVLGLLNLLFLSFVVVQLRYFFGGAALVQQTVGLTYAQYARQGFFELVAVAALVLPLLLALRALLREEESRARGLFQWLAGVEVALLFVIMASAMIRMKLYESEYGLTELRLYTSVFMGWLAVVFVWFTATVLRNRRPRFAIGALLSALAAVAILHAANPDAAIVRANLAHMAAGHVFDADYAASLGTDAVPVLAAALPRLDPQTRATVLTALRGDRRTLHRQDWRTASFSDWQASFALRAIR